MARCSTPRPPCVLPVPLPLLALLAGCAGGSVAPAEGPAPLPSAEGDAVPGPLVFGFQVPEVIEGSGFSRARATQFPSWDLGYALRYTGPELPPVDVYVYPVLPDGDPLSDEERRTRRESELEQAVRDVRAFTDRDGITLDEGSAPRTLELPAPGGSVTVLHRRLGFSGGGQPTRESHVLVGVAGRAYLKFRTTFPSDRAAELEPRVMQFVEGFVQALETGGAVGMANYDARAAILLPVPPDLPERFDFRVPNRLATGWQGQGLQRLPDGGLATLFRTPAASSPVGVQVFLRPIAEDRVSDPGALEAHWPGELEAWAEGLATNLAGQGLHPEGDPEPWVPMDEVETHYGISPLLGVRRAFSNEAGNRGEAFLAVTRIEDAFVVFSLFAPVYPDDWGPSLFRGFVEEFTANVLVGRPPPG
jgi:hypothetical protein